MAYEFENSTYPQLQIASVAGRVRFAEGQFATDDEAVAEALRTLPDWYGVTETTPADEPGPQDPPGVGGEGSDNGPEDIKPPARSASKADWVAYADSQDPADHESMTKEQLIEQYGGSD